MLLWEIMLSKIVIALGGNALGKDPYEQLSLLTNVARVIVDLAKDGNKVVITVADNGLGFDTSKLSADIVNEGHTGLYNIRRRLELRYGTNFLFEIHSEIGKGTEIRIELPKEDGR